jgi:hypothetical protein
MYLGGEGLEFARIGRNSTSEASQHIRGSEACFPGKLLAKLKVILCDSRVYCTFALIDLLGSYQLAGLDLGCIIASDWTWLQNLLF